MCWKDFQQFKLSIFLWSCSYYKQHFSRSSTDCHLMKLHHYAKYNFQPFTHLFSCLSYIFSLIKPTHNNAYALSHLFHVTQGQEANVIIHDYFTLQYYSQYARDTILTMFALQLPIYDTWCYELCKYAMTTCFFTYIYMRAFGVLLWKKTYANWMNIYIFIFLRSRLVVVLTKLISQSLMGSTIFPYFGH